MIRARRLPARGIQHVLIEVLDMENKVVHGLSVGPEEALRYAEAIHKAAQQAIGYQNHALLKEGEDAKVSRKEGG